MIWLSTKKVAELEQADERTIRRNIKKYEYRYINGVGGNSGNQYEIALESLPQEAQDRYHGKREEKKHEILLSLTEAQRAVVFSKQTVVLAYQDFKAAYHKADKLQAFLRQYNEQNSDKTLTKRQLNHWVNLYERDGVEGLVDRRGTHNKGQSCIPKDVQDVFLAYWLREKGTNRGGPSVASCYRLTQMNFPDRELPSVSSFERLTLSLPLPVKIYAREGKKAFDDKCMPHIRFDYRSIHTNQQWVADNHIFDVLVKFPDGHVGRAWMIGWMDRRSRYIVGYLVLETTPNADTILDAFARSVKGYGIPESVLLDNGKDYIVHDLFNLDFRLGRYNPIV